MALFTPSKKPFLLLLAFLGVAFWFFPSIVSTLPKDKYVEDSKTAPTAKPAPQKPSVRPNIIDYDDMANINASAPAERQPAGYVNIGPQRPLYPSVNGVPYVNVRKGSPETAGGNNHMRRQVKASPSGTVHMVYRVFDADTGEPPGRWGDTVYSPTDSNTNGFFFYNAYDCAGSNTLLCDYTTQNGKCYAMSFPGNPPETRPSRIQGGGIFVQPGSNLPVVYGQRYIQRTDLFNGAFTLKTWATAIDSAECRGKFSMDTSYTASATPAASAPVMHPLDSNVWVATFRNGFFPEEITFSYTTDAGVSWSPRQLLATNSPWFNSTEIASNGYDLYIVSMTDPNDPTAFQTTERPVYLKGTYNPGTHTVSFGTMQDIVGTFEQPDFLGVMLDIGATMVGDTLHVLWTDWNDWLGNGFPGPGGHVHHAAVWPDGTVDGPHRVANIEIDGRLPKMTTTAFGFGVAPWGQVELSYDEVRQVLYAIWGQPPPDGNYGWADYEKTGTLACYDLFMSASPTNGRGWSSPQNITQTNNPGCSGRFGDECASEWWFSADDRVSNDTIWIVALVTAYPGIQESAEYLVPPDYGPFTRSRDLIRLYKAPARTGAIIDSVRPWVERSIGDTTDLSQVKLSPGSPSYNVPMRLFNYGIPNIYLDSIRFTGTLNGMQLVTSTNAVPNTFVPSGQFYDFTLTFDPSGVDLAQSGLRSGLLQCYVHSNDPTPPGGSTKVLLLPINIYLVQTLCLNRKVQIHSGTNHTDIGSQGTIKDQSGAGMLYDFDGSDHFYDGGILVANSALQAAAGVPGVPRKVTWQLFSDKFLRCIQDIVLDSTPGTGSYYNLYAVSVSTDMEDSSLLFKNIWEQSTHYDSSDFLLQTTQIWNISPSPIDSVAMGVLYDVDVQGGGSAAGENVGGDTSVTYAGRKFWLGWIAGNDITVDTCSPNNGYYGFVVIPGSIGNPGDFVRPRGAVVSELTSFYTLYDEYPVDTTFERYAWNLDVLTSTRDREHDTLTGVWLDTTVNFPYAICGNRNTGPPYRTDIGYIAIAKKVVSLAPDNALSALTTRYGLQGAAAHLAAGVDSSFPGSETYTVIHVVSVSGLADLMSHAVKGIDWYVNHKNLQAGPYQISDDTTNQNYYEGRKGDLDFSNTMTPADVAAALSIVYAGVTKINGRLISLCVADMDNNGVISPSDFARVLNAVYVCNPAPCSNSPTALQQCSH